ncbi:hypothetical protein FDP41_002410 [Naegleria fowleri]|uniref:NADH dehydrogenase [ubiquinone] iron-sulfur protein 4, mitochondrial n=1 Tax=Naegleria fowleri TaxID=5763 RepID=A0A6A5BYD6_NAEFO|nr:uncharacterized protein FDP41_002410 [Naegleria fowleri]KAF0978590.1 hypothetical protein FDP41_002410 [Naegleria fowleri]
MRSLKSFLSLSNKVVMNNNKTSLNKLSSCVQFNFYSTERTTGHGSLISGVPKDQISRTVRIYRPSKSATQQGISKTLKWRVEWKKQSAHGEVWHDPMMGWNATNDPLMTTYMYFNSLEDAIDYCKSQGFEYEIEDPESKKSSEPEGKSYASKFKYRKEEEDW